MRAVVLLLVGSCLCWWVWKSSGISFASAESPNGYLLPADTTAGSGSEPGTLIGRLPADEAAPQAAGTVLEAVPMQQAPVAPEAEASRIETDTHRVDDAEPAPAGGAAQADAPSDRPAEVDLASALLHRPQSVVEGPQHPGVDPARLALAKCCAQALLGNHAAARALGEELLAGSRLQSAERAVVERCMRGTGARTSAATLSRETPLVLAASMAWLASEGREALDAGHARDAARVFSQLLLEEIQAPWKADRDTMASWTDDLRSAQAKYQWNRGGEWPAFEIKVEKGDSLISIRKRALAERPELLICTGQIERMNELRGAVLQPGQVLRIPTERASMIVDLDAHWTFYMLGDLVAAAWEVGVGKPGSETRAGEYRVGEKREEPMWFPAGRAPVPYGDPENPLGTRWIALTHLDGATTGLGFHGTNDPSSVGKDLSQGCVRMRNEDVELLFEVLPKGAAVSIRP
ncbi:MAG: L,D-transpeptidase family protein [Planctomycetota bacterium]